MRQPDSRHRCFRGPGSAVDPAEAHQLLYCLGNAYQSCRVFELGWSEAVKREPRLAKTVRANAPMPGGLPMPVGLRQTLISLAALLVTAGAVFGASLAVFGRYGKDSISGAVEAVKPAPGTQSAAAPTTPTALTPAAGSAAAPPSVPATATPPLPTATATPKPKYTVVPGDGWAVIATKLGVTMEQLLKANNKTVDTQLFAGMVLEVP